MPKQNNPAPKASMKKPSIRATVKKASPSSPLKTNANAKPKASSKPDDMELLLRNRGVLSGEDEIEMLLKKKGLIKKPGAKSTTKTIKK